MVYFAIKAIKTKWGSTETTIQGWMAKACPSGVMQKKRKKKQKLDNGGISSKEMGSKKKKK